MYFSELFEWFRPHEKQLTGATGDRRNVGLADHGTIFLDEIGDRWNGSSEKLWVLQDKSFYRVGPPPRRRCRIVCD